MSLNDPPRVVWLGGRMVIDGADTCSVCGARWVAWNKGITVFRGEQGSGAYQRKPVLRAYALLRCAAGHECELDEAG